MDDTTRHRDRDAVRALLEAYDRPGPRYTSYPTAPAWDDGFGAAGAEAALGRFAERADGSRRPLSIYVHVPFCKRRCLYCGCNTVIMPVDKLSGRYLDGLEAELELVRARIPAPGPVVQLHLGGGTPTYLEPHALRRLHAALTARFPLADDAEVSIEIDPVVTTAEHVDALAELGYNRISLGVQDLDPRVQQAVDRVQPVEQTEAVYERCRRAGFESINMDLIYGLPHQSESSFAATVERVIRWRPDRLAVFSYAHVPWLKAHQRTLPVEALPGPQEKMAMLLCTRELLLDAGYEAIGLDHFALPDDELADARRRRVLRRNFMGYTTKPESELLGFGVSAIGEIDGTYMQNAVTLIDWMRDVEAGRLATRRGVRLAADDHVRRDAIMDVMCNGRIDVPELERRHGIEFDRYFADARPKLERLLGDGLIASDGRRYTLTETGSLLARNVAMTFDAYLARPDGAAPVYSRTV